uniref:Integrase/recombinase plasmid associated, putative n=1 Tax=Ligilactobacillus acidipiscis TaxID=89059 RepID=A0A285PKG4_9LACO|nr:tyrosine-type recombinase/integrase [Ligilactobacillus acidipiscis]SNZ28670.1 integrase/recombinase plasmid associated, putative [Ligilactobacillus acidipiscis]SPM00138.1 integrase/recombinase plasmid associated, putative [Ligilactobacillus acidipiscis]
MKQKVLPIKDSNVLIKVQRCLQDDFKAGVRNYTIFQVGKATLLRVSDILRLKRADVFDDQGNVRQNAFLHDHKTGKANRLYLKPVTGDLLAYQKWLQQANLVSPWLFPSIQRPEKHIAEKQFYKIMAKVDDLLNLDYLGTHTMRKTGAYRVYMQSNYNIGLVMHLLNHSSEAMSLAYLGLDQASTEEMLDNIDFG